MSKVYERLIAELEEENQTLDEVLEDNADKKADVAVASIFVLLRDVKECLEEFAEGQATAEHYDKGLGDKVAAAIMQLSKMDLAAKIQFNPSINVDLKPVQAIANNIRQQNDYIAKQNETILMCVEKYTKEEEGEGSSALYNLIVSLVSNQNSYVDKIKALDYKSELGKIARAIPPRVKRWEIEGGREPNGRIKVTATAKE